MKAKYKNRKELKKLADDLGLTNHTVHAQVEDPVTKRPSMQLINNQRRFVRGILQLSLPRQALRIKTIRDKMAEAEKAPPAPAKDSE